MPTSAKTTEGQDGGKVFGRKKKRAQRLPIEGGAFMTLALATVAICAEHSDPMRATKYFGNLLLGAMASFGVGPDDGPDERAVWELIWLKFGGDALGEGWRVSALPLDKDQSVEFAESLAPLMTTPRNEVERVAPEVLAPVFGKQHPSQLELTELLPCLIAGVALRTIFEDAIEGPPDIRDDRVSIGALIVAVYLQIAALTDTIQEQAQAGESFRVTMTPLHLDLVKDGGPGTLRVTTSRLARFASDSGAGWDLGDLAAAIRDYSLSPDGSLSAGFNPPMPLMMRADGDDASRLDALLRGMGLSPRA